MSAPQTEPDVVVRQNVLKTETAALTIMNHVVVSHVARAKLDQSCNLPRILKRQNQFLSKTS